jgi:hypothetical protein
VNWAWWNMKMSFVLSMNSCPAELRTLVVEPVAVDAVVVVRHC